MGLFSLAPHKPSTSGSGMSSSGSHHISAHEMKENVRRGLHQRLGMTKGEEVYNILSEDMDKDSAFGGHNASEKEVEAMLHRLGENHQDNIHERDIEHIREVLRGDLND